MYNYIARNYTGLSVFTYVLAVFAYYVIMRIVCILCTFQNPGQSCGGPLPSEGAGGTGPNEYAMLQQ